MSLGELLDRAVSVSVRNFGLLVTIAMPFSIAGTLTVWLPGRGLGGLRLLAALAALLVQSVSWAAASSAISASLLGSRAGVPDAYGAAFARFKGLAVLLVLAFAGLVGLTIAGASIYVIGRQFPPLLSSATFALAAMATVPSFVFCVSLANVAALTYLLEGGTIRGAIARAHARVTAPAVRYRVFATMLVLTAVTIGLSFGGQSSLRSWLGYGHPYRIAMTMFTLVWDTFIIISWAAVSTLTYYDVRVRLEAFDLHLAAASLAAEPASF
jgi:hypothetical protein